MSVLNDMMNVADIMSAEESIKPLTELIEYIMALPDEQLNETAVNTIKGMIVGGIEASAPQNGTQELIKSFEADGLSKIAVLNSIQASKDAFKDYIDEMQPSGYKRELIDSVLNIIFNLLDKAAEQYHSYDIELPMWLDEGAQTPTYAHESDACADVYALETVVVGAHTLSNKIRTGIHIALPENWEVGLLPRSSIGSKTGLRLSNSVGVIDEQYRDELMILYDNISDSDYTINAGDRIAQMYPKPTYRFKAQTMSKEEFDKIEGNRGGGLGSTGM